MSRNTWSRDSRPSRRRGFTLLELLVVIGILVVLMAILLPALRGAREQSAYIRCVSNMSEIGKANFLYAAENDGVLPIPIGGGEFNNSTVSAILFQPTSDYWGMMDFSQGTLIPYLPGGVQVRESLFTCPDDLEPRICAFDLPPVLRPGTPRNFSYCWSAEIPAGPTWTLFTGNFIGTKISWIRGASHKFLIQEQFASPGENEIAFTVGPQASVLLSTRHRGQCNICFADGHVERFDPATLLDNTSTDVRQSAAWLTYCSLNSDR